MWKGRGRPWLDSGDPAPSILLNSESRAHMCGTGPVRKKATPGLRKLPLAAPTPRFRQTKAAHHPERLEGSDPAWEKNLQNLAALGPAWGSLKAAPEAERPADCFWGARLERGVGSAQPRPQGSRAEQARNGGGEVRG